MPKIGNSIPSSEELCVRCKSKRKISKTWTEKIENNHGFMLLKHTQTICTNKECQAEFEKILLAEEQKRDKLRQIKLDNDARRVAAKAAIQASK